MHASMAKLVVQETQGGSTPMYGYHDLEKEASSRSTQN